MLKKLDIPSDSVKILVNDFFKIVPKMMRIDINGKTY
jgi:hypothetical protein